MKSKREQYFPVLAGCLKEGLKLLAEGEDTTKWQESARKVYQKAVDIGLESIRVEHSDR